MKKRISLLILFAVLFGLVCRGYATDFAVDSLEEAEEIAYLNLDEASDQMKEKILDARAKIIFNTDWVADGYSMCITDANTGEVIREVPKFSEVFPDWDIPVFEVSNSYFHMPSSTQSESPDNQQSGDWLYIYSTN